VVIFWVIANKYYPPPNNSIWIAFKLILLGGLGLFLYISLALVLKLPELIKVKDVLLKKINH
jgi:hypothetical protein